MVAESETTPPGTIDVDESVVVTAVMVGLTVRGLHEGEGGALLFASPL
jgi:hypothetical protein